MFLPDKLKPLARNPEKYYMVKDSFFEKVKR